MCVSLLGYKGMWKGGNEREHLGVNLLHWGEEEVLGLNREALKRRS